jgi:hypothetical protein
MISELRQNEHLAGRVTPEVRWAVKMRIGEPGKCFGSDVNRKAISRAGPSSDGDQESRISGGIDMPTVRATDAAERDALGREIAANSVGLDVAACHIHGAASFQKKWRFRLNY